MGFMATNIKLILLGFVPVFAVNGKLLFKRLKLNLAEHFIIGGMCLLGVLSLSVVIVFSKYLLIHGIGLGFLGVTQNVVFLLIALFPAWTYYDATKKLYKFGGFAWRIAVFYLLIFLEFFLFLTVMLLTVTSESGLIIHG